MEEMKQKYGLLSQSKPPYEVLRTNWLSYEEVIRLKGVEEMVEVYYNSGQFRRTMKWLSQDGAMHLICMTAWRHFMRKRG